jgi:hypothetical protein
LIAATDYTLFGLTRTGSFAKRWGLAYLFSPGLSSKKFRVGTKILDVQAQMRLLPANLRYTHGLDADLYFNI